jgi:ELWxxDGT repeat protein
MKTSFWRRWCNSLRSAKTTGRASRARPPRQPLSLEVLEDRVTPSLTPRMVLDINPGTASSAPSEMVAIGSTTYFSANDGVHGYQLWKSDGTAAGTTLVTDISPHNLINVNGTLFFSGSASNGASRSNLWKSDGTAAGTVLVSSSVWQPSNLTNVNGTLYFTADDDTNGVELWSSDGTEAGTTLVNDIYPGSSVVWDNYANWWLVPNSSNPGNLTNVNGTLFFTADDGTNGRELWQLDGGAPVKDIRPGTNGSDPQALTNVNGTLFFRADAGTHGYQLWKSDGTVDGTVLVKDIYPGIASPDSNLTNVNGTLFFSANDGTNGVELWKSDGTAAGTVLVKDIRPGSYGSNPINLTNVNGTLFFSASNGGANGAELWKSDGTAAGTVLVKDINPGTNSSYPSGFTNVNGTVFFRANDGTHGNGLWKSDGTAAGTVPVANFIPDWLTNVNGTLFFSGNDGIHGWELWTLVDGPTQGTSLDVSGFPATITAGAAGSYTVTAKNPDGTTNTNYRDTVHFTSSDPQAALPADYTFTAADQGVHTFSAILKTAGSQSITSSDTVVPGGVSTQAGITVNPAAATNFTVAGFPSPVTAGAAGSFTVTAHDPYGNRATGYTGTVHFTSRDAKAMLPGNYTFTAADAGMHSFSATLKTAGTQSLTVTDTAKAALTGSQGSIQVNPAAASRLVLSAPSSVKANTAFSLTVTVVDAYGNVVTGYRGTLSFSSSDATANLPTNHAFTAADHGAHTFTGLVLNKKGKQTITLTDTLDSSLMARVVIDGR